MCLRHWNLRLSTQFLHPHNKHNHFSNIGFYAKQLYIIQQSLPPVQRYQNRFSSTINSNPVMAANAERANGYPSPPRQVFFL